MLITYEKIMQWILEGRGQGHWHDYEPWIKITRRGSPSGGNLQFRYIPQFDRHFHLLAAGELRIALLLLWLGVDDLRDQFPCWTRPHPHPLYLHPAFNPATIPWSEGTVSCARSLGIKHPRYPNTKIDYIPTIDLLATLRIPRSVRAVAFAIKPDEKDVPLEPADLEKLAIQKEYCIRLDILWQLISGSFVPETLNTNLKFLIHYSSPLCHSFEMVWDKFITKLNARLTSNSSINEVIASIERTMGIEHKVALTLFHRALWFRKTRVDLRHAIVMSAPPTLSDQEWVKATSDYMFGE